MSRPSIIVDIQGGRLRGGNGGGSLWYCKNLVLPWVWSIQYYDHDLASSSAFLGLEEA
jgi:hypothetical protein